MRRSRIAWGLVTLAAGSVGAWAASLEKSACNDLNAELAGMVATGTRADMERGPEWAKANLTREKLGNIQRLIEIEEQLEFRCGLGRSRIAATSPAAPAKRSEKIVIPEGPEKKPADKSSGIISAPAQAASPKPSPDANKPAPQKAAVAAPTTAAAAAAVPADVPDLGPTPDAAAAPNSAAVPKTAVAPTSDAVPKTAAAPGASPAPAGAAPKSSRRQSSATYVSPSEVNPFFVTRYGDTQ